MIDASLNAVMYVTVWLAVFLFVAGEIGKRRAMREPRAAVWPLRLWTGGVLLCALHMLLAIGWHHGWNHDAAVRATAHQTRVVFGIEWGGGVYVNYVFLAVWAAEALWWRLDPRAYFARPAWLALVTRVFCLTILLNAAVFFVPAARRYVGLGLIGCLLWAWRPSRVRPAL